ncbi:MAG: glycosyltransferase [Akkermansiaceae bacterium]|nr:glycosyltransferase [Akkermansiaceae bacterium]
MHIVHTIATLGKSAGGPSYMVAQMCNYLASLGHRVTILTNDAERGVDDMCDLDGRVVRINARGSQIDVALAKLVLEQHVDILHTHGLWLPVNRATTRAARRVRCNLIWSLHGMLRPWAMNHKCWKKKLAWWLFQRRHLTSASMIHTTSEDEAEEFRKLHLQVPQTTIPIGIGLPSLRDYEIKECDKNYILFLGRLHPVKGLMNLVEAISELRPEGWHCLIAGPDEGGYRAVLEARIRDLGLGEWFSFLGRVSGINKEKLILKSTFVILPSFTENFGVVVPEALSYHRPVLATRATPWSTLPKLGCGWSIDVGAKPLAMQLKAIFEMDRETFETMGKKGRLYVETAFCWKAIAKRFAEIYQIELANK